MFADLLIPPTFCFDWYWLGTPAGPIVALAVIASLISLSVFLIRRRVHKGWVIFLCLFLFVGADLVVYFVGRSQPRPRPRPPENHKSAPPSSE